MARKKPLMLSELRGLSPTERKERAQYEMEAWAQEMGDEKAIEVSRMFILIIIGHNNSCGSTLNQGQRLLYSMPTQVR